MSRKAQKAPDSSRRRKRYIWIIASILVILGGLLVALFLRLPPSEDHLQSASPPIQPPRTAPDLVVQQFCADLMSNNYNDLYSLISSSVRQQLDSMGGVTFLAQKLQQSTDKYGAITSCQITKVTRPSGAAGSSQATITTQIQRQHFQANQSETDQFDLILEPNGWAINKWTSNIATT